MVHNDLSLGSQRMRVEFYLTNHLEVFSTQDSRTRKELWNKRTATAEEKLSHQQQGHRLEKKSHFLAICS